MDLMDRGLPPMRCKRAERETVSRYALEAGYEELIRESQSRMIGTSSSVSSWPCGTTLASTIGAGFDKLMSQLLGVTAVIVRLAGK